jgi:ParB/RepB/Spo0J family partition protein
MTVAVQKTVLGYQEVELAQLRESPLNNRKFWDEKKQAELTESVRQKGVLTPLLVRPDGTGLFEIAAGHRRYRAAKAAAVPFVPVIAREMTDAEFLEVLTIENLQREDVHPMDEALGYKELVEKHGYTADTIADKIGKSKEYVYGRMKLADLLPEIQVRFYEDKLTAGHAILLARLPEAGQIETVKNGLFTERFDSEKNVYVKEVVSVRELASWIRHQLHLKLKAAPFSLDDASLIPAAGACMTCPKRTGSIPQLWPDVDGDTCTDRDCYNRKVDAFITRTASYENAIRLTTTGKISGKKTGAKYFIGEGGGAVKVDSKEDRCEHVRTGIFVDGNELGTVVDVCIAPICKKHHPDSYLNKREDRQSTASATPPAKDSDKLDVKMEIERKIGERLDVELLSLAIDQSSKTSRLELDCVAAYLHCRHDLPPRMADRIMDRFAEYKLTKYANPADTLRTVRKMSDLDLARFIVAYLVGDSLDVNDWSIADAILKARKIDKNSIQKRVAKELARQFEPTPEYDKMKCRGCGCTAKKPCKGGCWFAAFDICASCEKLLERHKPREIKVAPERVGFDGDIYSTICLTAIDTGKLKGFIEIEGQKYVCTGAGSGGNSRSRCDLTPIYTAAQWRSGPTRSYRAQPQLPSGRIPGYFGIRASWQGTEYIIGPETEEIIAVADRAQTSAKPADKKKGKAKR